MQTVKYLRQATLILGLLRACLLLSFYISLAFANVIPSFRLFQRFDPD
jgi:hypothetical protein